PGAPARIDPRGRRTLPTPSQLLTHIVRYNWPHGGALSLRDLARRHGRLEVEFDRRLLDLDHHGSGVDRHTFVVQYGNIEQNLEFLPSPDDRPPRVEDGCRAVFIIDPHFIRRR